MDVLRRLAADSEHVELMGLRLLVLCLLCYSGTRSTYSRGVARSREEYRNSDSAMRLFVPKRKNDQYRDGHFVTIAATGSQVGPVATVKRFIQDPKLATDSYLVCRIAPTKKGYIVKGSAISCSRARDILSTGLAKYLGNFFNFGTHSLRAGAASHAAM